MFNNQKVGAVIAAAGSSQRMGGVDKLFAPLGDRPVLAHTVDAFAKCEAIDQIVVVLSQVNLEQGERLRAGQKWSKVSDIVPGGERRQDSIVAGLGRLSVCGWVVIHDGARPLVNEDLIVRGLEASSETGAAVAAVPVTDTIKMAGPDHIVQGTPPRGNLWAVQTPQVFRFDIISEAYRRLKLDVTDDSRAVEQAGGKVKLYMGAHENVKITNPDDLAWAEILWQKYGPDR
jgi:2-C-methyl-D-erythritol 4-phosphate cytidylyltransferase